MKVADNKLKARKVPFPRSRHAQLIALALVVRIPLVLLISLNIDGQVASYRRDALSEGNGIGRILPLMLPIHGRRT